MQINVPGFFRVRCDCEATHAYGPQECDGRDSLGVERLGDEPGRLQGIQVAARKQPFRCYDSHHNERLLLTQNGHH